VNETIGGKMRNTIIYGIVTLLFIINAFTGCVDDRIHIEAVAHRMYDHAHGYPQALFLFNISNPGPSDIHNMTLDVIFFKIDRYELSNQLVNSTFIVNWSSLSPGKSDTAVFETFLDPSLTPLEALEIWNATVHWQMTFKVSWYEKRMHTTTQTFNWYFSEIQ
jgi:hypothetical protein